MERMKISFSHHCKMANSSAVWSDPKERNELKLTEGGRPEGKEEIQAALTEGKHR